jgi:hypothetical protein
MEERAFFYLVFTKISVTMNLIKVIVFLKLRFKPLIPWFGAPGTVRNIELFNKGE